MQVFLLMKMLWLASLLKLLWLYRRHTRQEEAVSPLARKMVCRQLHISCDLPMSTGDPVGVLEEALACPRRSISTPLIAVCSLHPEFFKRSPPGAAYVPSELGHFPADHGAKRAHSRLRRRKECAASPCSAFKAAWRPIRMIIILKAWAHGTGSWRPAVSGCRDRC